MTWLTRIFLLVTILAIGAGGFFANQLKQKRDDLNSQLGATKNNLAQVTNERDTTKKSLDTTSAKLKTTEGDLDKANADIKTKEKQIETEKAERQKVEDNLKGVNQQKADVQAELDKYKKAIPADLPPEQIAAKLKEFEDKLATIDQEKKVLQEQLVKLETEKKTREEQDRLRRDGKPVPGVSGHVVAVNADWNFVVLDIGSKQGLIENVPMIVYRANKLVGKIMITSVEPSVAIADILPEWKQEEIQEGDTVIF